MSSTSQPALGLVRRQLLGHLDKPAPELIDRTLRCLLETFGARAAFMGRVEDDMLEISAMQSDGNGTPLEVGLRLPIEETFLEAEETGDGGVVNVRDAAKQLPFKSLAMRQRLGIVSYLGVPLRANGAELHGTLAVIGKGPRVFSQADEDLLLVLAGLIAPRLQRASNLNGQIRTPLSAVRLASAEVKEPLAILRGYADMLHNREVPADQLPVVAERLASQSETVLRIADQVLLLSRLPLDLAFTVRVSLGAVAQAAATRVRDRLAHAGMELRLQLDTDGEVWGDSVLLEAALDEMLHNVFKHASSATVVQLRVRQPSADRYQLIVKDDGPGMSADRLADLFGPLSEEQPERGQGLGLYLLRRVAEAHGGRTWANSLEGKGTTFYLELPAASPDGNSARASAMATKSSA
jgi:signal transduction histidine kinase